MLLLSHVCVDVLHLDLDEEGVCVCVGELAAVAVMPFQMVVPQVVHENLRDVEDAHPHIYRPVEYQMLLCIWMPAR